MNKILLASILFLIFLSLTACNATTAPETPLCPTPVTSALQSPHFTQTPAPTYTPYPTYTPLAPQPTYTPAPTCPPTTTSSVIDLAHDITFSKAINSYRQKSGKQQLVLSEHLAYIAASRVQLTMIVKNGKMLDLGQIPIDPKAMPDNYAWSEYTFGGNDDRAMSIDSPQRALEKFIETWGETPLLREEDTELGASLLCNGQRCGFIVIFGHPLP